MKFTQLTEEQQNRIARKFNLPTNLDKVNVDKYNRPYERTKVGLFYYSIKSNSLYDSFHVHELKGSK